MKKLFFVNAILFIFLYGNIFAQQQLKSDSLDVLNYTIHLNTIDFSEGTIDACTEITITPVEDGIEAIAFDLLQLNISSIEIDGNTVDTWYYNDTLLNIPLSPGINIDDTISVNICYNGTPQVESYGWGGFHISYNAAYNLGVAFAADPHVYGRVWFPCFDEFKDRATYDIYVTIPEDFTAVCGGELISTNSNGNGTHTYYWKMNKTIPTYLASVAVSDYELLEDTFYGMEDTIPTHLYVKPNNVADAQQSFINLNTIIEAFEYYLGPYPWNRVGYVETMLGAMEHATNIAYPGSSINGNLSNEWLLAHELSHMWLGDKVTCASAADMWMNEGWAVYCESLYMEYLYGKPSYNENIREKHFSVIKNCHNIDGGYYPVYGLPHELTYGETVYEKGGGVVHTMRGYMGDSLFFNTVQAYLDSFAYNYASTEDMKNFFSAHSGIDMTGFFDGWVYSPGFPHFSVDSFLVENNGNMYDVEVFMRQKLHHAPEFFNDNKVELTFMSNDWETYTDSMYFSGQTGVNSFEVPFSPDHVIVDISNKMCDAITDYHMVMNSTGMHDFEKTYFKADVQQADDSAFVHVSHNWLAPDDLWDSIPGLLISSKRYWKIESIIPPGFSANGRFYFNIGALDNDLDCNPVDSLVLLYREDAGHDWQLIDFTLDAGTFFGHLITSDIDPGEYTLGIWNHGQGIKQHNEKAKKQFVEIYPNPSNHSFYFVLDEGRISPRNSFIQVVSPGGTLIKTMSFGNNKMIHWTPGNKQPGIYFINLINNHKIIQSKKIIYSK